MPRFYFDTYDDDCAVPDGQGIVLSDLEETKEEAIKALPDMARDGLPEGDYREFVVDVRDQAGHRVLRARLTLVVESLPNHPQSQPGRVA
jgi:Domain of unknown function (DUF6894)